MASHHHPPHPPPPPPSSSVDAGSLVQESTDSKSKVVDTSDGEGGASSYNKHVDAGKPVEESTTAASKHDDESQKLSASSSTGRGKFPFPFPFPFPRRIPGWAMWAIGSLILLAIPFRKKILRVEGMMEKIAGAVIDDVQAAAPVVKRIAGEIADSLPTDSILGKQMERIEHFAEDIEEEANNVEIWLDKVDEMTDRIEEAVDETIVESTEPINTNK